MPRGIPITLYPAEMWAAGEHAQATMKRAERLGLRNRFTPFGGETDLDVKTRGYAAEIAAARVTGLTLHWHYIKYRGEPKKPDIGDKVDVRDARRPDGRLCAYPGNPKSWYYVLVTGEGPDFVVWGWIRGTELMVPSRWETTGRAPAWWATQDELYDILTLPPDAEMRNIA